MSCALSSSAGARPAVREHSKERESARARAREHAFRSKSTSIRYTFLYYPAQSLCGAASNDHPALLSAEKQTSGRHAAADSLLQAGAWRAHGAYVLSRQGTPRAARVLSPRLFRSSNPGGTSSLSMIQSSRLEPEGRVIRACGQVCTAPHPASYRSRLCQGSRLCL